MSVTISVLYDNRCDNRHLQEGWGFSALIDFAGCKILFDTGGDPSAFTGNAEKMQVDFQKITHLLFSHRHWDHISGLKELTDKLSTNTALYVPKTFPWLLRKRASAKLKTTVVKSIEQIAPDIYCMVLPGGFWLHEQVLVLQTPKGLGIITGCAHPGIIHILQQAQNRFKQNISFVLGGFHLLYQPAHQSADVIKAFQTLGVQKVAPCHCSGDHLIRQFQEAYGPEFYKIGTGSVLSF
jgi:7,8-dihydropterin-6-yl-methyl-4-(beta-D-ribofuranosyl)aminobenzene 5'-phosphate synthase